MIELYMRAGCPFCIKVSHAAEAIGLQANIDFVEIDAAPGTPGRNKVLAVGGKPMVPFLIDGETSMYESSDIIAYLKQKSPKG